MRTLPVVLALVAAATAARADAPPVPETPLAELPYTRGLEPAFMDRAVDPCVDFYAYSCGGWQKANPIPSDQASWSVYGKQGNEIRRHLWGILLEAAKPGPQRSDNDKRIGDYFASCMDEKAVEARGAAPLQPALDALAALTDKSQLASWLAEQILASGDNQFLFGLESEQDASDSSQFIARLGAGGLGLTDRDDYLRTDKKSVEQRARYLGHLEKMLALLGDDAPTAKATAKTVMRLETALAQATLTRVEQRDPYKLFHKMNVKKLKALAPSFKWEAFFTAAGIPATEQLNVSQPKFFARVEALMKREPLPVWKAYLRWHLVNTHAQRLSRAFVEEDFEFYGHYLNGSESLPPRWKRCVQDVDRSLGEALGQAFVKKNFPPELKKRAQGMVVAIQKEMEKDLQGLDWMSDATRAQALAKLSTMRNKIGYPDKWRDYSAVQVAPDDYFENGARATRFEVKRQLTKIGQPLDRGEWLMTPQMVNAYYNAQMNDINFAAGVLQPPLFDAKMDDAPNYGNTGGTVGHELTHGFDDEGRQFDSKGNLRDWWTKKDADQFKKRAKCISDQYSSYVAVDDVHVNGKLTLGEDVADLGGLILAYRAWKAVTADQTLKPADALSPDQRFFVGYAQWACANVRPARSLLLARTDPHSPPRYRVNGLVVNIPEFAQAFSCKARQPMVNAPAKVCRVW